jgi:hypothetical protein
MKFLISNYSNPWHTEPYYFNAGLNSIDGVKSVIFNNQQSVYDNFDRVKPSVFITHASHISRDIVSYLKNNEIQLVVNTNWIEPEKISQMNVLLDSEGIKPVFFGFDDIKIDGVKYFRILPGADIFLNSSNKEYSIDKLIFVTQKEEIVELDGTYHYATVNQELAQDVDILLPITLLNTLFTNYNEVIFKGSLYVGSQLSFNAINSGTKVVFDTKDKNLLDRIDSIFKGQKLLSSVKSKHTCLHRLKTLLSSLHIDEKASELTKIIGEIK